MTSRRRDSNDCDFGAYWRSRKDLDSVNAGITVNDVDWIFHRYKVDDETKPGSRQADRTLQMIMEVETKSFNAKPSRIQQETLFMRHQILTKPGSSKNIGHINARRIDRSDVTVWHFGVYVLSVEFECPRADSNMSWGVFTPTGELQWSQIRDLHSLDRLLAFRDLPYEPGSQLSTRRHHKERFLLVVEKSPIGLNVERRIKVSS